MMRGPLLRPQGEPTLDPREPHYCFYPFRASPDTSEAEVDRGARGLASRHLEVECPDPKGKVVFQIKPLEPSKPEAEGRPRKQM